LPEKVCRVATADPIPLTVIAVPCCTVGESYHLKRVVGFEKRLDFVKQVGSEPVESFDMGVRMRVRGNREKAIVPDPGSPLRRYLASITPIRRTVSTQPTGAEVHKYEHIAAQARHEGAGCCMRQR
jgi:hypothetical protein